LKSLDRPINRKVISNEIPKDALVVEGLQKNAMGKVSKPTIKTLMEGKHA
jgi:hypothetical protein